MKYLMRIAMGLGILVLYVSLSVLAIDALEYESTGRCDDCLLLHKVSPSVASNSP